MTTIATECNVCPQGIKACAHFDGKVAWLVDCKVFAPHSSGVRPPNRWMAFGPGTVEKCECSADHLVMPAGTWTPYNLRGNRSLADAEAEFERRCKLLREVPE